MSAENEESLTFQRQPSSENSSNPLASSQETPVLSQEKNLTNFESNPLSINESSQVQEEEDFETAPLRGLLERAMDEMSDDQLRERVIRIRQLRTPQVFKAEVEQESRQVKDKPSEAKLAKQAEAFGDLL